MDVTNRGGLMIQDSLWKILSILICVVMLFVVPMLLSYQRQDAIIYNMVQIQVDKISEKVRESGYIDHSMLVELNSYLDASGNKYDVELEHLAKAFATDGTSIKVYYDGFYTDEIMSEIRLNQRYTMHVGDFFYIHVKNSGKTKGQFVTSVFGGSSGGPGIVIVSGGIVRYGDT